MSSFRRSLGWTLVTAAVLLHIFTVLCYTRQPDKLAAFTVMPIWLWGGIGLFLSSAAYYFLRAPLSLVIPGVWAVTLLAGADEAQALANIGKAAPLPGPPATHRGSPVLRVVTLNCGHFAYGDPTADLLAWHPDIVLLQQVHPHQVRRIAQALYGDEGQFNSQWTNGVVSRLPITQRSIPSLPAPGRNQHLTLTMPDGSPLHVVNIHLATAATDLRLWKTQAWRDHYQNRSLRKQELASTLEILEETTDFPMEVTLLGGDFNAPATDVIHHQLTPDFRDAFSSVGTGWGNTFHRRLPILRIDQLYATRHLVAVRCRASVTRQSDHRMVVADFLMPHSIPLQSP